MDSPDTLNGISTVRSIPQIRTSSSAVRPDIRHAVVVVDRMLRASQTGNDVIQNRLFHAARVLRAADPTETAFVSGRPVDVVIRLATRLVRRMGF